MDHSRGLAICGWTNSKSFGRESRTEQGRKSKPDAHISIKPRAGASSRSQTSVDVVLISFSPPPFCGAKPNDVPGDKSWLTPSHQHFEAHRQSRTARCHVHTSHAHTFWPAAGSFANCVPLTWRRYGEQMWLYSAWQVSEKKTRASRLWGYRQYKGLSATFTALRHKTELSYHRIAVTVSSYETSQAAAPVRYKRLFVFLHDFVFSDVRPTILTQEETH